MDIYLRYSWQPLAGDAVFVGVPERLPTFHLSKGKPARPAEQNMIYPL
jgi:hypothetical protein